MEEGPTPGLRAHAVRRKAYQGDDPKARVMMNEGRRASLPDAMVISSQPGVHAKNKRSSERLEIVARELIAQDALLRGEDMESVSELLNEDFSSMGQCLRMLQLLLQGIEEQGQSRKQRMTRRSTVAKKKMLRVGFGRSPLKPTNSAMYWKYFDNIPDEGTAGGDVTADLALLRADCGSSNVRKAEIFAFLGEIMPESKPRKRQFRNKLDGIQQSDRVLLGPVVKTVTLPGHFPVIETSLKFEPGVTGTQAVAMIGAKCHTCTEDFHIYLPVAGRRMEDEEKVHVFLMEKFIELRANDGAALPAAVPAGHAAPVLKETAAGTVVTPAAEAGALSATAVPPPLAASAPSPAGASSPPATPSSPRVDMTPSSSPPVAGKSEAHVDPVSGAGGASTGGAGGGGDASTGTGDARGASTGDAGGGGGGGTGSLHAEALAEMHVTYSSMDDVIANMTTL